MPTSTLTQMPMRTVPSPPPISWRTWGPLQPGSSVKCPWSVSGRPPSSYHNLQVVLKLTGTTHKELIDEELHCQKRWTEPAAGSLKKWGPKSSGRRLSAVDLKGSSSIAQACIRWREAKCCGKDMSWMSHWRNVTTTSLNSYSICMYRSPNPTWHVVTHFSSKQNTKLQKQSSTWSFVPITHEINTRLTKRVINQNMLEAFFIQKFRTQVVQAWLTCRTKKKWQTCQGTDTSPAFHQATCTQCSNLLSCSLSSNHLLDTGFKHGPQANWRKPRH